MASSQSMSFVRRVGTKGSDGAVGNYKEIGVPFTNVIDVDRGSASTGYSLDQLLDSYLDFIKNSNFVYAGTSEPKNHNVKIWLDTSVTNQS